MLLVNMHGRCQRKLDQLITQHTWTLLTAFTFSCRAKPASFSGIYHYGHKVRPSAILGCLSSEISRKVQPILGPSSDYQGKFKPKHWQRVAGSQQNLEKQYFVTLISSLMLSMPFAVVNPLFVAWSLLPSGLHGSYAGLQNSQQPNSPKIQIYTNFHTQLHYFCSWMFFPQLG